MVGEGAPRGGASSGAGAAEEGRGQVAQGGHDLGGVPAAQGRTVLPEGDIAHEVAALAGPVAAGDQEQTRGHGALRREAAEEKAHVLVGATLIRDRREQAGHLSDVREGKAE